MREATVPEAAGPVTRDGPRPAASRSEPFLAPGPPRRRLRPERLARQFGSAGTWVVITSWAVAITVIGAAPLAMAQTNRDRRPDHRRRRSTATAPR